MAETEALLDGAQRSAAVLPSILASIGKTPLVRLHLPGVPAGVELWGKCEWLNPGGSVKDRTALSLLVEGRRTGALRPGLTVIDSSSGNTAVGLALVGRALGHAVELVMPSNVSASRRRLCAAYGAHLVQTDAADGSDGALVEVRRRVAASPERYFYADQYRSPANPLAHYRTTAPEIWQQTGGRMTHFVAGLGTSGTLMGVSRFLRERRAGVHIAAVQPDLPFHGIEGLKHMPSALVPEIYDPVAHDTELAVATEEAHEACAQVLESDGLLLGHSAGAALAGARRLARDLTRGLVVAVLPDGGDRYLEEQDPA